MAQQIKKKFIGDDQVDGAKILLLQGQDIRREDGQGGEVDVIEDLQSQIDALDGSFASDADVTAVEQGAGLETDGSYVPDLEADYISGAVSLKDADSLLDDQIRLNTDDIEYLSDENVNRQNDFTNTWVGAGLEGDGSYIPYLETEASYISDAMSLKDADLKLAGQISLNELATDDNAEAIAQEVSDREAAIAQEVLDRNAAIDAAKLALGTNYSEADQASMIANTNVETGDIVFVSDDGDAKWAMYIRISEVAGDISDFQKISDQDAFENSISAAAIKTSYESNADTNAFTDFEKGEVASLRTEVDQHRNDIDAEVANRQLEDQSLQSQISGNDTDISTLQGSVVTLESDVSTNTGDISNLQSDVSTNADSISLLQTELDDTQAGAGLNDDGSCSFDGSEYHVPAEVSSLKEAIQFLDGAIETNLEDISSSSDNIDSIRDAAGLDEDTYAYVAEVGSNFLDSATSFKTADALLDAALKVEQERIDTLNGDSSVEGSVAKAIADVIDMAPEALNTLNELAASIGDDADFAGSVTQQITDAKNELKGSVSEAFDTMKEIEDEFTKLNGDSSVVDSIDNKVDVAKQVLQSQIDTNDTDISVLQSDVTSLQGLSFLKEKFVLTSTDIIVGEITLSQTPEPNSVVAFANRLAIHEGAQDDYVLSGTTLAFLGEIATNGVSALEEGDVITVTYYYQS